jgi:hypothetical protein
MVSERGQYAYRVFLQAISEVDDPVIHDALRTHIKSLHAFLVDELEAAQKDHKVTGRFSAEIIGWMLIHNGLGYGVLNAMAIPGQGLDSQGIRSRDVIARLLVGKDTRPDTRPE